MCWRLLSDRSCKADHWVAAVSRANKKTKGPQREDPSFRRPMGVSYTTKHCSLGTRSTLRFVGKAPAMGDASLCDGQCGRGQPEHPR